MGKIYKNNVLYTNYTAVHSGFTPIGTVISVMSNHAPANYLICDGSVYNISAYPELANHFATEFGSKNYFGGDGTTTFAVPDLRGEFLRGAGTNSHANQGSGEDVGEHQDSTTLSFYDYSATSKAGTIANYDSITNSTTNIYINNGSNSTSTDYKGSVTVRPTNTSVLLCIAVKNIFMDAGSNYSTEEQVVGTWINGKPIYQKTIDCGVLPNSSEKQVSTGLTNVNVIDIRGYSYRPSDDTLFPLPCVATSNAQVSVYYSSGKIYLTTFTDRTAFTDTKVTIQYTKTTD